MRDHFDHRAGSHFDIAGARIYFETAGNPAKPPLVLLHGGFGNIEDFNPLLPAWAGDFQLIGIDSRGHGASTLGKQGLSYQRIEEDVVGLLAHLGIGSASILGFSDGGITACRIAAAGALRIPKLVVAGTSLRITAASKAIYEKVTPDSWKQKFPATFDAYQRLNPEPDFDRMARAAIQMWLDPGPSGHPDQANRRIACPMLIVRGDDDHLTSLESNAELKSMVEGAHFMNVPFAGHVVYEDQQEDFLVGVNRFLLQPPVA
jgi:pimeloyl-ACP methyl ester carboxylesterase